MIVDEGIPEKASVPGNHEGLQDYMEGIDREKRQSDHIVLTMPALHEARAPASCSDRGLVSSPREPNREGLHVPADSLLRRPGNRTYQHDFVYGHPNGPECLLGSTARTAAIP